MVKKQEKQSKNKAEKQHSREEKIQINFSKNLYNLKAIKLATEEYKGLADFSFKKTKNYIQVELTNIDKSIKGIIKDEFCNYVFFLMKS